MESATTTAPLVLEVNAGLCNRLRALVAGLCWAQKLGRNLVVHWPSFKPECAADFYSLFSKESLPEWVTVKDSSLLRPITCLSSQDAVRIFMGRRADEPIYIISHGNFWGGEFAIWLKFLRQIKPSRAVEEILDTWSWALESTDIAVHIRRTDNVHAIRLSPFPLFQEKLRNFPQNQNFLVVSDDVEAIRELEREFGGRILAPEGIRTRRTLQGMLEATAVFFALTKMKIILGSAYSSFSEMARDYGGCSLVIVS